MACGGLDNRLTGRLFAEEISRLGTVSLPSAALAAPNRHGRCWAAQAVDKSPYHSLSPEKAEDAKTGNNA